MQTYGELKTAVADWLDREDLVAQIPDFIRLTEAEIYRDLRCQDNEFKVTYNNAGWTIEGGPRDVDHWSLQGTTAQLPRDEAGDVDRARTGMYLTAEAARISGAAVRWPDLLLRHV